MGMHEDTFSDERLMKLSAAGDSNSFESLIRRYARPLMTLINRMIGRHHRSEEVFQEVLFSCWKSRAQYKFPRPFKPWLYAIAINQCRQVYRKKDDSVSNQETAVEMVTTKQVPEDFAVGKEVSELLKDAVERLPEQQRAVVVLRIWSGLSYREIAQSVDRTEATVRSYMFHALKNLRERLGNIDF